jgi:hypothetical protein
LGAVFEKSLKTVEIFRSCDDEDFADASLHENCEGIIDEGFIEDRKKLLTSA